MLTGARPFTPTQLYKETSVFVKTPLPCLRRKGVRSERLRLSDTPHALLLFAPPPRKAPHAGAAHGGRIVRYRLCSVSGLVHLAQRSYYRLKFLIQISITIKPQRLTLLVQQQR